MIRAIHRFAQGLPVHYVWIILTCVCLACFSRAGPAVATLSMFVTPMTSEFGWSRTTISGAVSLGGVLAALSSPMLGSYLDRRGPRIVLGMAVLATGFTLMLLSSIESLVGFYLFYCVARMSWAGPYDLGIHGAVSNWFVAVPRTLVCFPMAPFHRPPLLARARRHRFRPGSNPPTRAQRP